MCFTLAKGHSNVVHTVVFSQGVPTHSLDSPNQSVVLAMQHNARSQNQTSCMRLRILRGIGFLVLGTFSRREFSVK